MALDREASNSIQSDVGLVKEQTIEFLTVARNVDADVQTDTATVDTGIQTGIRLHTSKYNSYNKN